MKLSIAALTIASASAFTAPNTSARVSTQVSESKVRHTLKSSLSFVCGY